jgi:hypothetical protein
MMKKLVSGVALAIGLMAGTASMAAPVTLADVVVNPLKASGGDPLGAFGIQGTVLESLTSGAPSFTLFEAGGVPISVGAFMGTTGAVGGPLASFTLTDIFGAGGLLLTGDYLDENVDISAKTADVLFANTGGTASSLVGDYFIVSVLYVGSLPEDFKTDGTIMPGAVTLQSAELSAIPLPAGGVLLIGGLGALAVARRRKAA